MEYEDELERMRDRRRRHRAQQRRSQQQQPRQKQSRHQQPLQRTSRRSSGQQGLYGQERLERGTRQEVRRQRESERVMPDLYDLRDEAVSESPIPRSSRRQRQEYFDDAESARRGGSRYRKQTGRGEREQGVSNQDEWEKGTGRKKKRHRFLFLKLLLAAVLLIGVYGVFQYRKMGSGFWTVAVFGVDSRTGNLEKGALSDVEMICVIDRKTGEIKIVSVYRDTYLEISPDGTYHKINEAYFKGGHEQAIKALERNLDLKIDDYATFNWKAVADAITILGGIDLEISESEFKYINGFITETVESTGLGSHHLEHAGMNHLDGVQAVAYARLRLMDTDYNRTARQRLVIQLAMNKAKDADFKTLTTLVQAIIPQLSTSIGIDDLLPMARHISKYHIGENGGFPFSRGETYIGKKDCVIPLTLESNVIQLHQFLYGTENYQPSDTVRQISRRIASDSGMGEVAENAPEAKVAGQNSLSGSGSSSSGDSSRENPVSDTPNTNPHPSQTETAEEVLEPETSLEESVTESSEEETSLDSESEGESSFAEESSSEPQSDSGTDQAPGAGAGPGIQGPGGQEEETDEVAGPGGVSQSSEQTSPNVYTEKPVIETTQSGPGV